MIISPAGTQIFPVYKLAVANLADLLSVQSTEGGGGGIASNTRAYISHTDMVTDRQTERERERDTHTHTHTHTHRTAQHSTETQREGGGPKFQ